MKLIYVFVILTLLLIVGLLAVSFIYFEKTSHDNFYYLIYVDGSPRGSIEIDKYLTENNIIYKSKAFRPYNIAFDSTSIKIELDKRTSRLKSYEEIKSGKAIKELLMLKKDSGKLEFLKIAKSKFNYADSMEIKEDALFFDPNAIVSILPFIKLYNYRVGGAQFFNALQTSAEFLPPSRCSVVLTSIRDEYIDVDKKKVKTECLVLRNNNADKYFIWVDKKDHNVAAISSADKQIYIKTTKLKKDFAVEAPSLKDPSYVSQRISFFAGDLEFDSILTRPSKEDVYPAVILFQGEDAIDKDNYGMFLTLADYLAKNGYVVLRFNLFHDESSPRFKSISIKDELNAVRSAISLLETFRFVDPDKIAIAAHADANYILPSFIKEEPRLKTWIMLSPRKLSIPANDIDPESLKPVSGEAHEKGPVRIEDIKRVNQKTVELIENFQKTRKNIMGQKVFMERSREILKLNEAQSIEELTIPILVLQGKMDEVYSGIYLDYIRAYIKSEKAKNHSVVSFRKLNHYLGSIAVSDSTKSYYQMDKEALETIAGWLKAKVVEAKKETKETVAAEGNETGNLTN